MRQGSPFSFRVLLVVSALAGAPLAGSAIGMTLLIGTTDLEPGHVTAVTESSGQLVRSGTGFVAIGAFGDLDDDAIRSAAASASGMQNVLGRFQQLGASNRFGLGPGLERIDGAFQTAVSAPTRIGDGLVGRPVYVVGGTESGLFIYKSRLTFEADAPVAWGHVDLWSDREGLAGGLLVGEVGESLEVLDLGPSDASLRLASTDGQALDLSRFESTLITSNEPPVESPPVLDSPPAPSEPSPGAIPVDPAPPVTPLTELPPSSPAPTPGDSPHWPQKGETSPAILKLDLQFTQWELTPWMGNTGPDIFFQELAQMDSFAAEMYQSMSLTTTTSTAYPWATRESAFNFPPVPEPNSALLTSAAASLLARRRRSRPHNQPLPS